MRTTVQIHNAQLATMGISPPSWYHYDVAVGDRVRIQVVDRDCPALDYVVVGIVTAVDRHGWYRDIVVQSSRRSRPRRVRLFETGPQDWGVVECRLLSRPIPGKERS